MKRTNVPSAWRWLLLICALLLTACSTISTQPAPVCPPLPAKPPARTQQPSSGYLESAQGNIDRWQSELQATPLTP